MAMPSVYGDANSGAQGRLDAQDHTLSETEARHVARGIPALLGE
jgi:hypothetical protein